MFASFQELIDKKQKFRAICSTFLFFLFHKKNIFKQNYSNLEAGQKWTHDFQQISRSGDAGFLKMM